MVTTVCLNPAIDQSAVVEQLQIGEVNRLSGLRSQIGGKGINVAIVLSRLQSEVRCLSCIGEGDIPYFNSEMKREGILFDALPVPGSVRRNLKVIDEGNHSVTELNQQGAQVDSDAIHQLTDRLKSQTRTGECVALCGSLPPGCTDDTYQKIMQSLPDRRWIADASGKAIKYALQAKPFLIKPNLTELEGIVGSKLHNTQEVKNAAIQLCRITGVQNAAVSLGAEGAIITDGVDTVYAPAVPVSVTFTVGAGDSFLAGLLYGIGQGETVQGSLRYGIAAGAACVQGGGVHAFDRRAFEHLLEKAEIRSI